MNGQETRLARSDRRLPAAVWCQDAFPCLTPSDSGGGIVPAYRECQGAKSDWHREQDENKLHWHTPAGAHWGTAAAIGGRYCEGGRNATAAHNSTRRSGNGCEGVLDKVRFGIPRPDPTELDGSLARHSFVRKMGAIRHEDQRDRCRPGQQHLSVSCSRVGGPGGNLRIAELANGHPALPESHTGETRKDEEPSAARAAFQSSPFTHCMAWPGSNFLAFRSTRKLK